MRSKRDVLESMWVGRPFLVAVLLLTLVAVEVWPRFSGDGSTGSSPLLEAPRKQALLSGGDSQQLREPLLSSPRSWRPDSQGSLSSAGSDSSAERSAADLSDESSLLESGRRDGSSAASVAAESLFDATLDHICWSSEPISTTSSNNGSTTAAAAAAADGVVVAGKGCSGCVPGEQCSMHVWVKPPAHWVPPWDSTGSRSSSRSNTVHAWLMALTHWGGSGTSRDSSSNSSSIKFSWLKKDLALTLQGPALGYGEVQCVDPPACSHFLVSYRLWDVGVYRATVHVACANLNFSSSFAAHFSSTHLHDLAAWTLSIGWPHAASEKIPISSDATAVAAGVGGDAGSSGGVDAGDVDSGDAGTTPSDTTSTPFRRQASPCAGLSIPGRWKKADNGNYTWVFFPCAPAESPPDRWITGLSSKGIREINLVGDSHQRLLAVHLHFLLTGDATKRNQNMDLYIESRNERNETLKINFHWVDGIYRNEEFGCGHRGKFTHRNTTFPTNMSTTADVTIVEAGYWANGRCAEPDQAMRAHLPEYLNWGLQFAARTGKPIVLRTSPPVANVGERCAFQTSRLAGPSTNLALMELNRLMRSLAAGGIRYSGGGGSNDGGVCGGCEGAADNECGGVKGKACYIAADKDPAQAWDEASILHAFTEKGMRLASSVPVFDSWKIEAPRFMDVCPRDHHYSCYGKLPGGEADVRGPVGEAVVRSFVHFLMHKL